MIHPATLSPNATATDRLIWVLDFLRLAIAERHRELGGAMTLAVWKRVGHYRRCFLSLAARVLAGELARRRPPRASSRPPRVPPSEQVLRLPTKFAWMCVLVPSRAACHGGQLRHLLTNDAELMALVSSDPRFGRLLRPLLRATGQTCPPCVPPPPPRRHMAPRPAAPSPSRPGPTKPGIVEAERAPRVIKQVTGRALRKYLPWNKPRPLPAIKAGWTDGAAVPEKSDI